MNKILRYSLITIISLILILFIYNSIYPRISHWDCYKGGGRWTTCGNTCRNDCEAITKHLVCGTMLTPCCYCGPNKCWDGINCIRIEEYLE